MNTDSKFGALVQPSAADISDQLRALQTRTPPPVGKRQVIFNPVEVILCLAASRVVKWNSYGGSTSHTAPIPVQELARLFKRPPSSIIAKMANLFGGRAHQGKFETDAADWYLEEPARLLTVYEQILGAARQLSIGSQELPDFLPRDPSQWAPW